MKWQSEMWVSLLVASCCCADTNGLPYKGRLLFQSNRSGNEEIYLRDERGVITNLTNNPAADTFPSWAPDGKRIVFVSNRSAELDAVYIMDANGGNAMPLISNSKGPVTYPHFSGDGKKIVFTGPYARARDNLYLYDRATKEVTGPVGLYKERCEWGQLSVDGHTLAFMQYTKPNSGSTDQGWHIKLLDLDTGVPTYIDHGCEPFFSKDGTKLIYVHFNDDSDRTDLHVYDIATAINKRYTNIKGFPYSPRFTPDGKWIAFAYTPDKATPEKWELFLMAATPFAAPVKITSNTCEDNYPDFR